MVTAHCWRGASSPLLLAAALCCLPWLGSCTPGHRGSRGTSAPPSKCAIAMPQETAAVHSRHTRDCEEIPDAHYSYSVQSVATESVDSMQSTEFTDADKGLIGSFELEHSLKPADTLLIILGGEVERLGAGQQVCQRLAICNLSVDGRRQRLKLNVSLDLHKSYTMKIFKFTDGSGMCEEPQVRFFYTRSRASENPLVQMAVGSCDQCSEHSHFKCQLDMYLRTERAAVRTRVFGDLGDRSGWIDFTGTGAHSPNRWERRPFEMNFKGNFLTVQFYYQRQRSTAHQRTFYRLDSKDESSLPDQLCRSATLARCPTASPAVTTVVTSLDDGATGGPRPPVPPPAVVASAATLALALALLLMALTLARRRLLRLPPRRSVLLVFPDALDDAAAAAARIRRCDSVRRFLQELRTAEAVKRGRLRLRELAGLRSLTPDLARDSRLIIFLSDDPAFQCFPLDSLSADARLVLRTVLTEKHRTRGFFINIGPQPPPTTDWARLTAQHLGETDGAVRNSVSSLTALCGTEEA